MVAAISLLRLTARKNVIGRPTKESLQTDRVRDLDHWNAEFLGKNILCTCMGRVAARCVCVCVRVRMQD